MNKSEQNILDRIRLDEIESFSEVIDCCREVLLKPTCYEQALEAHAELEFASQEYEKLIKSLIQ